MQGSEGTEGYKGKSWFHDSRDGLILAGGRFNQQFVKNARGHEYLSDKPKEMGNGVSAFDGRPFVNENDDLDHGIGTVSMVCDGGKNGSEFFICLNDSHAAAARDGRNTEGQGWLTLDITAEDFQCLSRIDWGLEGAGGANPVPIFDK